jgi:hypothetical protein
VVPSQISVNFVTNLVYTLNQIQERRLCDERYGIEEIVSPDRAPLAPSSADLVQKTGFPSQQLILIGGADPGASPRSYSESGRFRPL